MNTAKNANIEQLQSLNQEELLQISGGSEIGYAIGVAIGWGALALAGFYNGARESAGSFGGAYSAH